VWFYDIEKQKPAITSENESKIDQPHKMSRAYRSSSLMAFMEFIFIIIVLAIVAHLIGWELGAEQILSGVILLIIGVGYGEYSAKREIERSGIGIRFIPKYRKYLQRKK
jgi:hypothetical protein